MATSKLRTDVLANTRVDINLGPLNAPVGAQGGRCRVFASAAAIGTLISVSAGTRFPISNAVPNLRAAGGVLRNEDGIGEVIAGPLSVFSLTLENTTVGDIIVETVLDIDGIPGT